MKNEILKKPLIVTRAEIEAALPSFDCIAAMERGFAAYSAGSAIVPPVGEILFHGKDAEAHIKSGYIDGDDIFVVKVATGFYRNDASGLPSNSGAMLVFSANTGFAEAVLLDEGFLTNYRTAAAGAMAAKYLAPKEIEHIGILGSGTQARLQAELLKSVTNCRAVIVWARRPSAAEICAQDLTDAGFAVQCAKNAADVAAQATLLVTTTASKAPLLRSQDIRPGTHINAVGADTPEKQELESDLLARADVLAVDSLSQARERGELRHALAHHTALEAKAVELGNIVSGKARGRTLQNQITIADLTGVAVQDIEIAKSVLAAIKERGA